MKEQIMYFVIVFVGGVIVGLIYNATIKKWFSKK